MDDIMRYVSMRVNGRQKVKVRNREDLKQLILKLDDVRQSTKKGTRGNPRITEEFVEKLMRTRRSGAYIGADIGRGTEEVSASKALEASRDRHAIVTVTEAQRQAAAKNAAKKKGPRRILRRRATRRGAAVPARKSPRR